MSVSREMKDKINQFAREQSQHYLENAEMTYLEKLRRKTGQTKNKLKAKMAKLKNRSETAVEAQNDMILYMSDYMNDLIEEGCTEQQAFERAKEELRYRSDTARSADLQERFAEYYANMSPAHYEAIGLFYAGFLFFGLAIGALVGFLLSGGQSEFLSGGWISLLVGAGVGFLIGMGCGMISHAIIALNKRE